MILRRRARVPRSFKEASDGLPSSLALALLRKATKGLKGTINLPAVEEVFELLGPGWSVQEGIGALNLTESNHIKLVLKDFCAQHKCDVWGYSGVKEPKELWFKTQEQAEATLPALKALVERCGPKGPANPRLDQLYIAKINDTITQDFMKRWKITIVGVWYGRPAFTVTTPNGSMEIVVGFHTDLQNLTSDRFWKLVYQSGLKERAQQLLGSFDAEQVDRVLRPSTIRDMTNTGTCPVCFGNFKLVPKARFAKDKTMPGMVLHGYKRPGTGYVHGNCFGQDWPPFELSPEGTRAFLVQLKRMQEDTQEYLGRLKKGDVQRLTQSYNEKTVTREEVTPEKWQNLLANEISSVEQRLQSLKHDIKTLTHAADTWTLAPLPG